MENEPVVRLHDTTYQNRGNTVGIVLAANLDGEVITQAECASLWAKYQKEAQALIDPVDGDHRLRNKVISGAYADLYLNDSQFTWAGLAAYASKQVGCAMDHAAGVKALGKGLSRAIPSGGGVVGDGMAGTSQFLIDKLGQGNRALFLDIYPPHLFFRDHGFDKMARCASARQPPLTPELLRGFKALEDGDAATHLTEIAYHEQVNILQEEVYNSTAMRRLLDVNQARFFGQALPLTQAPDVTMSDSCDPNTGATIAFPLDEDLYDVPARMDWILNDIGGYYQGGFEGSDAMYDHLRNISSDGASAAGASGGGSGGGGGGGW